MQSLTSLYYVTDLGGKPPNCMCTVTQTKFVSHQFLISVLLHRTWQERKFLVLDMDGSGQGELQIGAFVQKDEIPAGAQILGHVTFVQVPWLPGMQKKRSGFSEEDELF